MNLPSQLVGLLSCLNVAELISPPQIPRAKNVRMDICVRVADSLHCIVETNTMVYDNYAPSKKKTY